jgi:adenosylcobinamide-GDP ribazoletransferase
MVLATTAVPYARPAGLAEAFLGDSRAVRSAVGVLGLVVGGGLAVVARQWAGLAAIVVLVAAAAAVVALARARIGGFTGDVLGAAAVIGETSALLAAAARW